MNDIITIQHASIAGQSQPAVDARQLHSKLGSQSHFSDWIRSRIEVYQFIDGQDYISISEKSEKGLFRRPRIDYTLTLDMAKELAMVERSEMGRQIRRYFIDMERRARVSHRQFAALRQQMLAEQPHYSRLIRYKGMGLTHVEIAKLLELGVSTIRRHVRQLEQWGLLTPPANLAHQQSQMKHLRHVIALQGVNHA